MDGAFGLVAAQPSGTDRVCQVPGEVGVVVLDGADRGTNAHGYCFTGSVGRVAGNAASPAQADGRRQLVDEHPALGTDSFGPPKIRVILGGVEITLELNKSGPVCTPSCVVKDRPEAAAERSRGRPAGSFDQVDGRY